MSGDLRLSQITKEYGDFTAVAPLDLTVPQGSFFALLGPSGCGKTTTLRMIAGLEEPTAGTIQLGDTDITWLKAFKRPVNTVFQSYALFPHLTIRENVGFGLRRRKVKDVDAQVTAMLDLVELGHLADRKPAQISGGQQQRVALARALVNQPEVLLLDEPLGALDLKLRRQMQLELKRIQTEVGLTFIHVTHDQEEAMTMADTIAVMNAGRIEQMGSPTELYDLPQTAFVANFLGQSNLVAATVTDTDGDYVVTDMHGHRIRARKERAADNKGRVWFGIRPEKVHVAPAGGEPLGVGSAVTGGVVADVSFVGVSTQYLIRMPWGDEITVFEQNLVGGQRLRPGDEVDLNWDPDHAFLLDSSQDATAGTQLEDA